MFIPTAYPHLTTVRCCASATPSLDAISPSVKLRAVAISLATANDPRSLDILREMSQLHIHLDPSTTATLVDSFVNCPHQLHVLHQLHPPPRYAHYKITSDIAQPDISFDPEKIPELSVAFTFLTCTTSCLTAEIVEPNIFHHPANEASTLLLLVCIALAMDRYTNHKALWQMIIRGVNRIFTRDPVRQTTVDAAHFLVAYSLGIPSYPFRPTSTAIHRYISENNQQNMALSYAVWMAAGVVCELDIDGRLVETDVNTVKSFIKHYQQPSQLYRCMFHARHIINSQKPVFNALVKCMLKGGSVGDCVVILSDA